MEEGGVADGQKDMEEGGVADGLKDECEFMIRTLSPEDTEEAFNLVDKEGWNMSLAKFRTLREEFPDNVFVTVNEKTREIVGVVSALPTRPGQFVVGMFVVRKDFRGQGLGGNMMEMVTRRHRDHALTLTSLPGVDHFYRKHGFKEVGPTHYFYVISVDRVKVATACSKVLTNDVTIKPFTNDVTIKPFTPELFQAVNDYATVARGFDGRRYLSVMTRTANSFLVAMSTTGQVVGYAHGVDSSTFLWVDGMFADRDDIALLLFRKLLDDYPDKKEVIVQTIKPREYLVQFGDVIWSKSQIYPRMATKDTTVPLSLSKVYAVTECNYSE